MKIIATGNDNVILQATTQEVNMLAGKDLYRWSDYHRAYASPPSIGTNFNVVAGITQLHRNSNRAAEVQRLKGHLKSIIDQLELLEPFMKEPDPVAPEGDTAN